MGRSKILVVDDNDELLASVSLLLRDDGFEPLLASDGEEALKRLREDRDIRAIVLDIEMPVMNGATFRGAQLADPAIAAVPLVVLSGRPDLTLLARAMRPDKWLRKPLLGDELLDALAPYR